MQKECTNALDIHSSLALPNRGMSLNTPRFHMATIQRSRLYTSNGLLIQGLRAGKRLRQIFAACCLCSRDYSTYEQPIGTRLNLRRCMVSNTRQMYPYHIKTFRPDIHHLRFLVFDVLSSDNRSHHLCDCLSVGENLAATLRSQVSTKRANLVSVEPSIVCRK